MGKLRMVVLGQQHGKAFKDVIRFSIVPPKGRNFWATCQRNVEVEGKPAVVHYVDVPYHSTKDMEGLARSWIRDFYGQTVKEIKKVAE